MKEEEPALKGPWLAQGSATPLASSVTVPDATEVPVQVLEVVKNVNVTVPVGAPQPPFFFFFNDTATTEIYALSLHDALPIFSVRAVGVSAVTSSGSQGLSVAV